MLVEIDENKSGNVAKMIAMGAFNSSVVPLKAFGKVMMHSAFPTSEMRRMCDNKTEENEQRLRTMLIALQSNKRQISSQQFRTLRVVYNGAAQHYSAYKLEIQNFVMDNIERFTGLLTKDWYGSNKRDLEASFPSIMNSEGKKKMLGKLVKKPANFLAVLAALYPQKGTDKSYRTYGQIKTYDPVPQDILELLPPANLIKFLVANPITGKYSKHSTTHDLAKVYYPTECATASLVSI